MQSDGSLSFGAQNKGVVRSFGLILLQRLKEGVTDGLLKGDPFRRVVLHHLLNQVKQLLVVSSLGGHIVLRAKKTNSLLTGHVFELMKYTARHSFSGHE